MENKNDEKKRALNIIWNASEDYSFIPDIDSIDEEGNAEPYFNYIIGAVKKYYDYELLQNFFNYLKIDTEHEMYEKLTWIGLEGCAYNKGKVERPVLEKLRIDYSKKVLNSEEVSEKNILNEISNAHYMRALGVEPQITGRLLNILNDLEFDEKISTEQIIQKMHQVIKDYFKFNPGQYEVSMIKNNKNIKNTEVEKVNRKEKSIDREKNLIEDIEIESAETSRDINFLRYEEKYKKVSVKSNLTQEKYNTNRNYIQKYYGSSILTDLKTKAIEHMLCVGVHKKSHLHFTRGEFNTSVDNDANLIYRKKVALEQREMNLDHYNSNYAKNHSSISKLTNKIRNIMFLYFESSVNVSKYGKLAAEKIWRNINLNDKKVFVKNSNNDLGNLSVDILLDASASQFERQEIIASQGYIIAESFTQCQIPVRVYSFCSLRDYTIITMYRDYNETDKNDRIFNYNTTGCNRDGLAIRTSLQMMEDSSCDNKILIVLSDCKPNDIESNPITGIIPVHSFYSGANGVYDTALEVKKGTNNGVSIICVFTGEDKDLVSAKKIYGHNFVRISSTERFADIVGVLMQNQLKNL